MTVLGAVTHDGWSFYCLTEEYLTDDHGIRPIGALEATFGERLVILIDRAPYFPPRFPELNPVEQCWTQLDQWFNYLPIEGIEELK